MTFLTVGTCVIDGEEREYVLDEVIGHGGFGYVFKAHRKTDNAVFAIKTMLPSFGDSSSIEAFKNEIKMATSVDGENIIRYEYVNDGDKSTEFPPYIIMEYAEGGTLSSFLKEKKDNKAFFSNNELIMIFKQLAQGMKRINEKLVHRDIKPDNILISKNTFKISDFGLSKVAIESTRTMTFKGYGTPLYMAPEAWDFTKNTIQMDMYSMGIIFYELAAMRYPYDPIPKTQDECKDTHLYSAVVNLGSINRKLSPSIVSVINRMLEKAPKKRFNSWDDIIKVLDAQVTPTSALDKLVASAIATKNTEDSIRQSQESEAKRKAQECEAFLKLVSSQFQHTIIAPIIEMAEGVNRGYCGEEKITFRAPQFSTHAYFNHFFSWEMSVFKKNNISIKLEAILKENHTREVYVDRIFGGNSTRRENYIPQYKGKNILAWGEITNTAGYGYNILLLDSGELYGDWIIMHNKNNFSYGTTKVRREPFAFTLKELPSEIDKVQMTHLYRADFKEFNKDEFLQLIGKLSFDYLQN